MKAFYGLQDFTWLKILPLTCGSSDLYNRFTTSSLPDNYANKIE